MNYFWKQSWPLANSGTNSENIKIFLSRKVNQNAWECLLLSTLLKSNSVKLQRGRGNGYQTTSIYLGKRGACPCQSHSSVEDVKYLFSVPGTNSGKEEYEWPYEEGSEEKAVGLEKKEEFMGLFGWTFIQTHVKKRHVSLVTYWQIPHQTEMQAATWKANTCKHLQNRPYSTNSSTPKPK